MGSGGYDVQARTLRADSAGYATAHANDAKVFVQAAKREVNEGMDPRLIIMREARDNEDHHNTVPVILALDATGSMGRVPVSLIKTQLPILMQALLAIHPDVTLCFMIIGDDRCDKGPLQVGQFEASDERLDHWLTRSWLEGDGGGNGGESYALPWLFAINKIVTDAWEKRQQRGILITVGDEPIHGIYHVENLQKVFGDQYESVVAGLEGTTSFSHIQIHAKASEKWDIHHLSFGSRLGGWNILGENVHSINGEAGVTNAIVEVFQNHVDHLTPCGVHTVCREASPEVPAPTPTSNSIPEPI
jgi:hypothetical protein